MADRIMTTRHAAETFPASQFVLDEMRSRGWSRLDLARALRWPVHIVHLFLALPDRVPMSPAIAEDLASAFGTSAEVWINLAIAHEAARSEWIHADIEEWREAHE